MKRFFLFLTAGAASVIGLTYLVAALMPGDWQVTETRTLLVPASTLERHLLDITLWHEWNVWLNPSDAAVDVSYPTTTSGVGAVAIWQSEAVGDGKVELTGQTESTIVFQVTFGDGSLPPIENQLSWTAAADTTEEVELTWTANGNAGDRPLNRLYLSIWEEMMQADIKTSLAQLATVAASSP